MGMVRLKDSLSGNLITCQLAVFVPAFSANEHIFLKPSLAYPVFSQKDSCTSLQEFYFFPSQTNLVSAVSNHTLHPISAPFASFVLR